MMLCKLNYIGHKLALLKLRHGESRFNKAVKLSQCTTKDVYYWLSLNNEDLDSAIEVHYKGQLK